MTSKKAVIGVAVVAIVVIACAAFFVIGDGGNAPSLRTELKVGDYIEYENTKSEFGGGVSTYIDHYEIISISNGKYYVEVTEDEKTTREYMTAEEFLSKIKASDEDQKLWEPAGTAKIDTNWGKIKCDKYQVTMLGMTETWYVGPDGVLYEDTLPGYGKKVLKDTSLFRSGGNENNGSNDKDDDTERNWVLN